MPSTQRPLPEFDAPPVDEVVLGVQFPPIEGWKVPFTGMFWQEVRADYPQCEVHSPLPSQIERFGAATEAGAGTGPTFQFVTDPNVLRCWFLDATKNNLIQLQPDRFLRNWRQVVGGETYPRYSTLRPAFERDWRRFQGFLAANGFSLPSVLQCEVTYINNIEKGEGWDTFADLGKVTPLWSGGTTDGFLPAPESASIGLSYTMDNEIGRLRVSLSHAIRVRDGKEILQLQLLARGKPKSNDDVMEWLDSGREWVVRAFADVTTPEMHKLWRRRA